MTNTRKTLLGCVLVGVHAAALAQTMLPLRPSDFSSDVNRTTHTERRKESKASLAQIGNPQNVVFIGDRVIPHFVDGGSWQTAITLVNLENHSTQFDVLFFKD